MVTIDLPHRSRRRRHTRRRRTAVAATFLLAGLPLLVIAPGAGADAPASAPSAAPASQPAYTYLKRRSPDGIGKVYMGREIAQVMGHLGAGWLERPEREREEQPRRAIEMMALRPTDVVADIGAGSGYFSFRIAALVPRGKVLAVDIQQEMLDLVAKRAKEAGVANVEPVLGTITDPKLPDAGVDVVLMVDAYHEFDHPQEMMTAIVKALKPGGRVVQIEYRGEDPDVPIKRLHKMTEAQAKLEMAAVGLEFVENKPGLPQQHLLVFRKPEPTTKPAR
ncbi:MAG TPA: methyltransferase domain-containing protein [Humisphaera sp.]